jgi:hypothetical protein
MEHGRDHQDRLYHARTQRASNIPPDEPTTDLEAEMLTSGRHKTLGKEGVIGAHMSRPGHSESTEGELEGEEPRGPGLEVGPTARAAQYVQERRRGEKEGGRGD